MTKIRKVSFDDKYRRNLHWDLPYLVKADNNYFVSKAIRKENTVFFADAQRELFYPINAIQELSLILS